MITLANVSDYRLLAQQKLSKDIFDYIDAGAGDEITKRDNREAFNKIKLRPFCLRDLSCTDVSSSLFGIKLSYPILIAPTAFHQLIIEQGEISTAKAAKLCTTPMVVSSMSNYSLEDIAAYSGHDNLWLQTYIFKKRPLTEALIQRAEQAGYKAIVITVGVPVMGKRDRDVRNQFILPPGLSTGNFKSNLHSDTLYHSTAQEFDLALTWKDIEWVLSMTKLPVILKGILNPLDADKACQLNIAGIVVSNHGGRQLDTAEASILALPDIAKIVNGRTKILLDGGIERGTDIFKALAFGADAILLGRPILWALAVDGERGVKSMLTMLQEEFETVMKLTGCCSIQDIKNFSDVLCHSGKK